MTDVGACTDVHCGRCRSGNTDLPHSGIPLSSLIPGVIAKKDESAQRKGQPVARGCLRYFPDALLAVSQLSLYGNDKHNPGQPLHWSKEKSSDHADCVIRHLIDPFGIDYSYGKEKPVLHSVAAAWRALANAQTEIEELRKQGKWPL